MHYRAQKFPFGITEYKYTNMQYAKQVFGFKKVLKQKALTITVSLAYVRQ